MDAETAPSWRVNLVLAAGVIFTIILGLLMAQLDYLQTRLSPTAPPIARITSTIASGAPLAAIILPTTTSNAPSATPLVGLTETEASDITAVPTVQAQCGRIPDGWIAYLVQYNDTFFSLALDTGITESEIVAANCLGMQTLVAGMQIYLPKAPPRRIVCGPPAWWVRYTVEKGDTMFSLAGSRGTTVWAIQNANCFFGEKLLWGRQIYLPPLPPTATWTPTVPPPPTAAPATAVPTIAATATQTPPPIPTATATAPPPPTATAVVTTTATFTPIPTATIAPTAVATATMTFTPAPTDTPTALPTSTDTPVPTATFTPVPTATAVDTPTPTPTP